MKKISQHTSSLRFDRLSAAELCFWHACVLREIRLLTFSFPFSNNMIKVCDVLLRPSEIES